VHGESPELHGRTGYAHQEVWFVCRWQGRTFEICRLQTCPRTCGNAGLPRRRADQHLGSFESANLIADEGRTVTEHVVGDVVRIRPHTHLRIVVEVPGVRE